MAYETVKTTVEINAVDIPTMAAMSEEEYAQYIRDVLLIVDHHDVLRSGVAGYPLAATRGQIIALIAYLTELNVEIGD